MFPVPIIVKPARTLSNLPMPGTLSATTTTTLKKNTTTPDTMADDEPVDPLTAIREKCGETKSCLATMSEYKACIERVANKGFGTCEPWFFDYVSCVDKCTAPKIMKATK